MSKTESYKFYDLYLKENNVDSKKIDGMREIIHKAVSKEALVNWRKHVPVYGWTAMNYPSTIKQSLLQKYPNEERIKKVNILSSDNSNSEYIQSNILMSKNSSIKDNSLSPLKTQKKQYLGFLSKDKHPDRLNPEKANEFVMQEIEHLIQIDHSQKFMKNYKPSDLRFFKEYFQNFEKTKANLIVDPTIPHIYNHIKDMWSKSYLYELGYKKAFTFLTTDEHKQKVNYIDINLFFDKKYSTMYPKSNMLGPKPDKGFSRKIKKIGDISFEEENNENENVKNLSRPPPENITEEWLKFSLNHKVELLKLENCYWLSKDVLSKLGRMDENLKQLSLRNLDFDNSILTNILKFAKNLELLDLSNCNGLTLGFCEIISTHLKNLKSLKLTNLNNVTNVGLESLIYLESLTDLDISMCQSISDKGLIKFSKKNFLLLQSLNLSGLFNITNEGLKSIISANSSSLLKLIISLLPQKEVDGSFVSEIQNCKKLIHLDLSGCSNLNNDSVYPLFSNCLENLENLSLCNININDFTAEAIVGSNKYLKILRLSNSKDLTNSFLDYIQTNPNNLLLIELNRTKKIDDDKIKETVFKKSPNLRIIRATNNVWDMKNNGLKVPLINKHYVKPVIKGAKQTAAKKNDDKNPVTQLKKILEENKPKRPLDLKV